MRRGGERGLEDSGVRSGQGGLVRGENKSEGVD